MADSHKFENELGKRSESDVAPSDVICAPGLVNRALEIARKRRRILDEMRAAIQRVDKEAVFALARRLTGLNDETCSRTDSRFN
jgi:hypothetical protein